MRKVLLIGAVMSFSSVAQSVPLANADAQDLLAALAASHHGRLGVFAIDMNNNQQLAYQAQQRFPLCSTAKVMTVGAILKKSMAQPRLLSTIVSYRQADIKRSGYAPITSKYWLNGMSVSKLCAAAITASDNMAMNLLMKQLGGPAAITAFARSMGNHTFRLDRWEPKLNSAIPGDPRDTTTPESMAQTLRQLLFGDVLAAKQRTLFKTWLIDNTTGKERIRAGVPEDWLVGDKTGGGDYGTTNDVAVLWPKHCKPIVLTVYFTQKHKDAAPRSDVIAAATRIVIKTLALRDQCVASRL